MEHFEIIFFALKPFGSFVVRVLLQIECICIVRKFLFAQFVQREGIVRCRRIVHLIGVAVVGGGKGVLLNRVIVTSHLNSAVVVVLKVVLEFEVVHGFRLVAVTGYSRETCGSRNFSKGSRFLFYFLSLHTNLFQRFFLRSQ